MYIQNIYYHNKQKGKKMIQAIYFALCFAAIFLGCIISIHVDFWIGLGIMILFTVKFMIQLPNNERI